MSWLPGQVRPTGVAPVTRAARTTAAKNGLVSAARAPGSTPAVRAPKAPPISGPLSAAGALPPAGLYIDAYVNLAPGSLPSSAAAAQPSAGPGVPGRQAPCKVIKTGSTAPADPRAPVTVTSCQLFSSARRIDLRKMPFRPLTAVTTTSSSHMGFTMSDIIPSGTTIRGEGLP